MRLEKVLYTATATATGGRAGTASTPDRALDVQLSTPKELGGTGGPGTNPEQLFAAGYSACFIGAMRLVAGRERLVVPADIAITTDVAIGPTSHGFGIQVAMRVHVPGWSREQTEKVMHAAHQVCPYSNATRGNVDVELSVA